MKKILFVLVAALLVLAGCATEKNPHWTANPGNNLKRPGLGNN